MDIILYNIITGFCCLFLGYIFGSIPTGVIIGKVFYHKDPRTEGSKNSGGTNVGRLMGKKAGLIVIILDMIKLVAPLLIVWSVITFSGIKTVFETNLGQPMWDDGILYIYLAPLGAAIGHCWPLFANFKGGKAVASFGGFGLATSWFASTIGFATFFITLKLKKYVSLASIISAILGTLAAWGMYIFQLFVKPSFFDIGMWGWGDYLHAGWEYALVITLISAILIIRHAPNIKRLMHHEERKITWMD